MTQDGKLRKMGDTKKINDTTFMMEFMDQRRKRTPAWLLDLIEEYDTVDTSKCEVKAKPNTGLKLITIRITIQYPDNTENIDELMKINEEEFMDYYKNEIGYI